ncbi:MAG: phospholipase D family protein [Solirubrobacteraceae bacterium]
MGFRFTSQPFPGAEQVGVILRDVLRDVAYDSAWFATAWGKRSGLSRLASAIEEFRSRGGRAEAILGVDEGGATIEGLELALELFDAAYVFHDPGSRTYHPKIYVVQNDTRAHALVGSGNLTRGGLFTNFEAGVAADLLLAQKPDADFLRDVRAYYDALLALRTYCKPLTRRLIKDLEADPRLVVVSERQANRRRSRQRQQGASEIFGRQAVPDLLGAPPPEIAPVPHEDDDDDALVVVVGPSSTPSSDGRSFANPVARWWKKMSPSDAHRKPATSHERNFVTLTQARRGIDHKTWFRDDLFGDHVAWANEPMRSGNIKEVAVVPFDVYMDGDHLGTYNLTVDHAENRVANQNNAPTYLNWSSLLPVILATDFRDWWLELSRLSDGTFRLQLFREEPSAA